MAELDELLKQMEEEEAVNNNLSINNQNTNVAINGANIDIEDDDSLMAAVFNSALDDKRKADDLYDVILLRMEANLDRSPELKTVLSESVNHRINATGNLIKILELKKKYDAKNASSNPLVALQVTPRESGINMKNLTNEILNN